MRSIHTYPLSEIAQILAAHVPDTAPSARASRNAAVAMILREATGGGLETLFIQRAAHPNDPWSGQMAFPGGRVSTADSTIEEAARRETEEEVGIVLDEGMRIGRLHDIEGGRLASHRLAVAPFVYFHPSPEDVVKNYEVADTVWVPLSYLGDAKSVTPYVFHQDPARREFPSFQYEGYTIWGLTYRIIVNFMRLFDLDLPTEGAITEVE